MKRKAGPTSRFGSDSNFRLRASGCGLRAAFGLWLALVLFFTSVCARALIVGPYWPDAHTLHLWHLNEAAVPAVASASNGTNLVALGGSASLGNASFTGFGNALSAGASGTASYCGSRAYTGATDDNTRMTYADTNTGAFTMEALVRVGFDPSTNWVSSNANLMYLVTGENQDSQNRPFQWSLIPKGVSSGASGDDTTQVRLRFFAGGSASPNSIITFVPSTGPDAIAQGKWYHVAVTFTGGTSSGSLKQYWTLMDASRVQASLLAGPGGATSQTMSVLNPRAVGAPCFMLGNQGRSRSGSSLGCIDEVRLSNIARSALDMMFNTTNPAVPVSVFTPPASQTASVGDPVSLSVVAFGTGPLAYQWRFNGLPLGAATQTVYAIASAQTANSGNYDVVITNRLSAVTSPIATLSVRYFPVSIETGPVSQTVPVGEPLSLSVSALGSGPLSYQWRQNGGSIPGATRSTYGVASAQESDWGNYDVIVANSFSAVTSAVATVTVATWDPPALQIARAGSNLSLSWPVSVPNWTLQSAASLSPSTVWNIVTNPVVAGGNQNTVLVSHKPEPEFFRLVAFAAVHPINWSQFNGGLPADANAQRASAILRHACQYALTTWWTNKYAAQDAATYLDLGGTGETNIRAPAMEAYGLAVALQTGLYDPTLSGISVTEARRCTLKLVRSLGYRHLVNQPGGWGNVWQSAHWAALTGTAGWMLWTNLSALDQEYVRRAVEYEANRFTNYTVPYYMNRAGTIVYPGDTKTEENAWNASVLHLAACMMPAHANASIWRNKAIELTLSAHARPSDINRTNVYHGRTLASWLNGSNANEDSTVINHNFIHPDYMVAGLGEFQPALVYLLAGKPVPQASFFNLDYVYAALVDLNFVVGAIPYPTGLTNRPPGGYVYVRDALGQPSTNIYYPNGNDWGTGRRIHFVNLDAIVHAFGLDALASTPADGWEAQQSQMALDMQARFTDGRTYGAASEDTYASREEWVCNYAAKSYLTKWLVHQGQVPISNSP